MGPEGLPGLKATLACCCAAAGVWGASKVVPKLWQPVSPQEQLLAAAKRGSMADVTRALAAGALVDSRDPATRETALIAAAGGRQGGHMDVLQALLAAGACPDYTDAAGNAALHAAAGCGNEGHALALLQAGGPADQPNLEGLTPIEVAFEKGHIAVVLALLSFGADPAPLQKGARANSWAAFRRAHAAALRQAELALQQRLEQQWQESAASSGGGASTSSSAWADWPADPQEQPERCPICYSEPSDFTLDSCGCAACFSCLRTHATTEIKQGQQPRCPLCVAAGASSTAGMAGAADGSSGGLLISHHQLEYLLDPADLLLHDRRQLEQLLSLRSCPHCGEVLELDRDVDLLTATCPHPRCRRRLHVEDVAAETAFRRYSQQQRFRECPSCGAMVERAHGCNHMTCRCKTHFCYVCGTNLTPLGRNLYSHFGDGCPGYG